MLLNCSIIIKTCTGKIQFKLANTYHFVTLQKVQVTTIYYFP